MISVALYCGVAMAMIAIGAAGLLLQQSPLRQLICINVCGAGIFLLLTAMAYVPTLLDKPANALLHALVLTGLVVATSATALGLAIAKRLHAAQTAAIKQPDQNNGGQQHD